MSTSGPPEHGCYTLICPPQDAEVMTEQQLSQELQHEDPRRKAEALKKVIRMIINGEKFHNLLMIVIRYVMPSQDHMVKKLLLLFWEVVPKYSPDGKLRQEMILVCDAYRRDLQHPNEYIRGCTLRFLCKLKEAELLEPLMPAIRQCLEHRHSYVRRNAVMAIFTIYKNFDFLIPDAPEKISTFLEQEQDASCKRNAFMMLLHVDQERALSYLATCLDQVHTFGDIMQLVIVELIYKVCHANPGERSRFIRCVYNLLQSNSAAVRYEAASTLVTLSSAPTAIKAVTSCYIDLILKESDNNVKLIVLDRLMSLRDNHEKILQDQVMDILRILGASDLEVRKKTLELAMELVTSRTVEEVVGVLRKELVKACASGSAPSATKPSSAVKAQDLEEKAFRYQLVHTIYQACVRFPDMIVNVVPTLCETLTFDEVGTANASGGNSSLAGSPSASEEVCRFLRESIQRFPHLKGFILEKIVEYFPSVQGRETLRLLLWILGEFSTTMEEIHAFMNLMRQVLGQLPLVDEEMRRISGDATEESPLTSATSTAGLPKASLVTADGTYATQSALTTTTPKSATNDKFKRPPIQACLFLPDFLPGVVLSVALVKLFCRYRRQLHDQHLDLATGQRKENSFAAECMLMIASMIHLGRTKLVPHAVNPDHFDRMWFCLKSLADRHTAVLRIFDVLCSQRLVELVQSNEKQRKLTKLNKEAAGGGRSGGSKQSKRVQVDHPIRFLQLCAPGSSDLGDLEDRFDLTLSQALGSTKDGEGGSSQGDLLASSKLSKVRQLTGFSDPIYAEAYVHVNQYDIVLDVLVVNQTTDTLQNLTLELATLGDLKLVEKPQPLNLAPQDFANIKASIKVSSSENGIIFGNIVYDVRGSAGEGNCVVLNDIHIDIMEYILPASCTPSEYQRMWNDFEWENKVTVNTKIQDLHLYLQHMLKHTNMRCLTPPEALQGACDYLCVTMYARSIFGEHVLTNLCLERPPGDNQTVVGHIRIRAKTQGMAVTMGEKMSAAQKLTPTVEDNPAGANGGEDPENRLVSESGDMDQAGLFGGGLRRFGEGETGGMASADHNNSVTAVEA